MKDPRGAVPLGPSGSRDIVRIWARRYVPVLSQGIADVSGRVLSCLGERFLASAIPLLAFLELEELDLEELESEGVTFFAGLCLGIYG